MKRIFVFLFCLIWIAQLSAQKKTNYTEIYRDACDYLQSNDYQEAYYNFNQLVQNGYASANISYLSGKCLLNIPGRSKDAIPLFEDALKNISSDYHEENPDEKAAPLEAYFYLAQAFRLNNRLDEAEKMLNSLLTQIDTTASGKTLTLINHELEYCRNARELMSLPVKFKISNPGEAINKNMNEINPAVTPDETLLLFVEQKKFYDAILESRKVDDQWTPADEITSRLGSDGEFRVCAVSADGQKMLLTSYDMYSNGDIYESVFKDGKWSKCKKLGPEINSPSSENFASYSPDGNTLYFSSNRPLGYGGYDIYRAHRDKEGKWTNVENLGPMINTAYDETYPILSNDSSSLYFSSNGHFSMGGYDIFCSRLVNGKYTYARNIGYPINTTGDNLFWVPVQRGRAAWTSVLSQAEPSRFELVRYEPGPFPDIPRFSIAGEVVSESTPFTDTSHISLTLTEKTSGTKDQLALTGNHPGFAFLKPSGHYTLFASSAGYNNHEIDVTFTPEDPDSAWHARIVLNRSDKTIPATIFSYRNIFFAFDSYKIEAVYAPFLDSVADLLNRDSSVRLELIGYTDHKGSAAYNLILSNKRARSIMHYLISKNITPSRITCSGKGSANPIARELSTTGKDILAGRKWNRRVEFRFSGGEHLEFRFIQPGIPANLINTRNR